MHINKICNKNTISFILHPKYENVGVNTYANHCIYLELAFSKEFQCVGDT